MYYVQSAIEAVAVGAIVTVALHLLRKPKPVKQSKPDEIPES